jgi:hypothetical protein
MLAETQTSLLNNREMISIKKHIHFHPSLDTCATGAFRKGIRIDYSSMLMDHNSIRTTRVDAKIVNDDLNMAMTVFDV